MISIPLRSNSYSFNETTIQSKPNQCYNYVKHENGRSGRGHMAIRIRRASNGRTAAGLQLS